MDRKLFWNEVAKYGVLLGVTMSASKIFEQTVVIGGGIDYAGWIVIEWLLSVVLFFAILFKATQKRAASMDPALGFSFGQGVNYMMLISIFAAIPVACLYYVYINSIVGYDNYVDGLVAVVISAAELQPVDSATASTVEMVIEQIKTQAQPSIFDTLFATIFQYTMAGLFAGLILSGFTSRKPDIFNEENE